MSHSGFELLQVAFLTGVLVTALTMASAARRQRLPTLVLSAALLALGGVSLLLLSGAWGGGSPVPATGWDRYLLSVLLVLSGATAPFTLRLKARWMAFTALTTLRFCLWYGAMSQLAYLSLGGGFARLFAADTAPWQLGLFFAVTLGWLMLLRGDRRWLAALTAADRSVALARFLMPLMLLPIVAAAVMGLVVRRGAFPGDASPLLIAEFSSIALVFVGLAALRGIWAERRRASTLAKAAERSPVIIHSEFGVIEYWPRGCEVLYGYTAAEAVGRRAPEILRTEYPMPVSEVEAILRRTGEWAGEIRQTTRDGRRLWIATQVVVDRPETDSEFKLVETVTDVTDLKISNAALRDTTESFEQIVAGYELGTVDYRPLTGQSRFSPQIERILGLEPGELGSDESIWTTLIHPDDTPRLRAMVGDDARVKASGRTAFFKIRHRDGTYRSLQAVVRYEFDGRGRLSRMVGVYMDVTEILHDRMEAAANATRLLDLQSELAHTSRLSAMGELAAGLAHELNQPLAAVGNSVGAIEMMLKDDDKPLDQAVRQRVLRAARHAESQTVRAGEILRRLREFIARGEADTQTENLASLVDDALALALPNPAAVGVTVKKSIPRAATLVLADRIQVQQVLVNLIRNAAESMRDHEGPGLMSIKAQVSDGMALVRVIDNGGGVADERLKTLFSPFETTKREGMGVGLSICRRIIEAHGGELWFEPTAGQGAEFRFTLPLALDA